MCFTPNITFSNSKNLVAGPSYQGSIEPGTGFRFCGPEDDGGRPVHVGVLGSTDPLFFQQNRFTCPESVMLRLLSLKGPIKTIDGDFIRMAALN